MTEGWLEGQRSRSIRSPGSRQIWRATVHYGSLEERGDDERGALSKPLIY
jgi:hypothetical protein